MAYTDLTKKRANELRWYYRNKDKIRQYKKKIRQSKIVYVRKLKEIPCKDCGIKYPHYVMDFDHVLSNSKKRTINRLAGERAGWLTLKQEIKKCEIVCANCHRIRTHNRRLHQQAKQE